MLISESLLQPIVEHLQVSDIQATIPFIWSSKECRMKIKSALKLKLYKFRVIAASTYTTLVICQILWTWKKSTKFVQLHSIFCLSGLLLFLSTHFAYSLHNDEIISFFNGMLKFERERNRKNRIKFDFLT